MIYLDTNVAICLCSGDLSRLTPRAAGLVDTEEVRISPIVLLELKLLGEVGKIDMSAEKIVGSLAGSIDLKVCAKPLEEVVMESLKHQWTRDPFDRLITAHAACNRNTLITFDEKIRDHYPRAVR